VKNGRIVLLSGRMGRDGSSGWFMRTFGCTRFDALLQVLLKL